MYTFRYRWCWYLESSPQTLWPLVSDTDRFDATAGLPPITVREEVIDGQVEEVVRIQIFGVPIEWIQKPFEWIEPREFTVRRQYLAGPLRRMDVRARLEPAPDGGTHLHYHVDTVPANLLGYVVIPFQVGVISRHNFERTFRQFDRIASAGDEELQRLPLPEQTPVRNRTHLEILADELRELDVVERLVDALVDYLTEESDDRVARIRPFVLADLWDEERIDVLTLCLYATRVGLLDLQWDLICPACRGTPHRVDTLRDVDATATCPACHIDYEVDFEHTVEVTFQVHPSIRAVDTERYCHRAPRDTDHVLAQQTLGPGEVLTVPLDVSPGAYRIRLPWHPEWNEQVHSATTWQEARPWQARIQALPNDTDPDTSTAGVALEIAEDGRLRSDSAEVAADRLLEIRVSNASARKHLIVVERTAWLERAATAARVTTLQAFRDFFATEALKLGLRIRAGTITVLFTDLEASTRLYHEVGDGPAFERVAAHFDILRSCVEAAEGALVKTIGDAVMAVFLEPGNAVRAALEILAALEEYNREDAEWPLQIKLGLHTGAALAVALNGQLDYFGTTVNLAARLERESAGGEVVLSDELYTDRAVQAVLDEYAVEIEPAAATLSGFDDEIRYWRVRRRITAYQATA